MGDARCTWKQRHVANCRLADPRYGADVAQALGLEPCERPDAVLYPDARQTADSLRKRKTIAMVARITPVAFARMRALLLLYGLAACTGSPATLALQPDFEVTTPAGITSVSIRQSPPGMTDAEFTQLVKAGMEGAARGSVIAGRVEPPFPSQRIVWHVNLSASRGISRLVVNVFDGPNPYAYEQETVTNSAPTAVITSAVESMSERLLADVAAQVNMPNQLGRQVPQNETDQTILSPR
jgi:hypothetical protein